MPSTTPVENEYSLPDTNTYDVPRSLETPNLENIQTEAEEKVRSFLMESMVDNSFFCFIYLASNRRNND